MSGNIRAPPEGAGGSSSRLEQQAASAALYHPQPSGSESGRKDGDDGLLPDDHRLSATGAAAPSRLEKEAASAALYHPHPSGSESGGKHGDDGLLDDDHRLSAAGAAASLKYAKPKNLPSYPVAGLRDHLSAAGAAASLAHSQKTQTEQWKPGKSASAAAAAMVAKHYKMAEPWRPEPRSEGSTAANLAAKEAGNVKVWKPSSSDWGHSAAAQAVRAADRAGPKAEAGLTADARRRSLRASNLAMAGSRRRADSSPAIAAQNNLAAGAGHQALSAAGAASDLQPDRWADDLSPAARASRITNIGQNLPREMYGSRPPVSPEVEERKRADALRSAAVSMAKQMYNLQQNTITDATRSDRGIGNQTTQAIGPVNLEEAARKLAAERLAKLQDEHAAYREYYGTSSQNPPSHRLSMRSRPRRRASSFDQASIDEEDEARPRRMGAEKSIFSKKAREEDGGKRQKDREALLAAAQRNVRASLHSLDEQVFSETGKMAPSLAEDWRAKAQVKAEADSQARMVNHGRVNIGGGKYIDRSDVEAVAARNVQPVLDEINNKAELHHAKQEEMRQEREQARRFAEEEKAREKELKAEFKKVYVQDKEEARRKKQEEKAKRADEKLKARVEKRQVKESTSAKRKSNVESEAHAESEPVRDTTSSSSTSLEDSSDEEMTSAAAPSATRSRTEDGESRTTSPVVVATTETVRTTKTKVEGAEKTQSPEPVLATPVGPEASADARDDAKVATSPPSSAKGESRVKSWIKDRFTRHGQAGKDPKADVSQPKRDDHDVGTPATGDTTTTTTVVTAGTTAVTPGQAPSAASHATPEQPLQARGVKPDESRRDVDVEPEDDVRQSRARERDTASPVSPMSEDDVFVEPTAPGPTEDVAGKNRAQASAGKEDVGAGAGAGTGTLAPPAATFATDVTQRSSSSPVRDSKFLENL